MSKTIEIQGQLYDAESGSPLGASPINTAQPYAARPRPSYIQPRQQIDRALPQRPAINALKAHAPEPTPVLMRSAVKRPAPYQTIRTARPPQLIDQVKPVQPARPMQQTQTMPQTVNQQLRNTGAPLNRTVNYFSPPVATPSPATPPVATPSPATPPPLTPTPTPIPPSLQPAPTYTPPTSGPISAPSQSPNSGDVFTHALEAFSEDQSAHEPRAAKRRGRSKRRLAFMTAVPVMLLAIGIIMIVKDHAYTRLQLALASASAGFRTTEPGYVPAGYNVGQLNYKKDVFASTFTDKTNGKTYTLTEKKVGGNGQVLLETYVAITYPHYQSVSRSGQTIYLYGNGTASWVKNGIWYQVTSHGSLNNFQLINVADSI